MNIPYVNIYETIVSMNIWIVEYEYSDIFDFIRLSNQNYQSLFETPT